MRWESAPREGLDETTRAPAAADDADGAADTQRIAVRDEDATAAHGPTSEDAPDASGSPVAKRKSSRSLLVKLAEVPLLIVLAFAIAIVIKTFLVQAFYIPSGSMIPTLRVGDRVLVEKLGYRWGSPQRGHIVVFERSVFDEDLADDLPLADRLGMALRELLGLPTGRQEDYIKRIVAVGGDSIRYAGSPRRLIINGEEADQDYIRRGQDPGSPSLTGRDCERLDMQRVGRACRVPGGTVFVMGDNRGNSEDSRVLGPVPDDEIVGRAFAIIWPLGNLGRL